MGEQQHRDAVPHMPVWDRERHLDAVTRMRRHPDPSITIAVDLGDRLATSLSQQLETEDFEPAGSVVAHSGACLAALAVEALGLPLPSSPSYDVSSIPADRPEFVLATILCNILGFAGERLVRDGRAFDLASSNAGGPT